MKRAFEFAGFISTLGFLLLGILRFLEAAVDFGRISLGHFISLSGMCLLGALIGWVLADLFSGLVHFIADNFGHPATPIVGPLFIAPFREHHDAPEAMLHHGFLERNANNALVTSPLFLWIPWMSLSSPFALLCSAICLNLSGWLFLTNEIHAKCHQRPTRGAAYWLQQRGLILAPEQHDVHHAAAATNSDAPASRGRRDRFHYCITCGICDRLARRLIP